MKWYPFRDYRFCRHCNGLHHMDIMRGGLCKWCRRKLKLDPGGFTIREVRMVELRQ